MSGAEAPALPINMYVVQESFGLIVLFLTMLFLLRRVCDPVLLMAYGYFVVFNFQKLIVMAPPPEMPLDYFVTLAGSVTVKPLVILSLLFVSFIFIPMKWVRPLLLCLTGALIADMIWFLCGFEYGVMNTMSFDTSVAVLLLPWLFHDEKQFKGKMELGFLLVLLLLVMHGRTALLSVAVMALTGLCYKRQWKSVSMLICLMMLPFVFFKLNLLDPNGRVEAWRVQFKWWKDSVDPLFGLGLGGFKFVGPWLPVHGVRYFLLHNEFLQVFFETGLVGLGVFLVVCLRVLYKAYRQSMMGLMFCLGLLVSMMTYFPFRFFISQMMILLYMKIIFYEKNQVGGLK